MTVWSTIKEFFKPLTDKLEWLGKRVQKIVNFILLFLVYFTAVALTSIFSKIAGKKFLDLNPNSGRSFWINEETITKQKEEYQRMF